MSESVLTKLVLLEEYRFNVKFDIDGVPNLVVDEMKPIGKGLFSVTFLTLIGVLGHR